jgi:hypothetical protein
VRVHWWESRQLEAYLIRFSNSWPMWSKQLVLTFRILQKNGLPKSAVNPSWMDPLQGW